MTTDLVGPVLEASEQSRPILQAIRELNPAARIHDAGAYWRVLAPVRCELTRAAVERAGGAAFRLPQDLEKVMPSFQGVLEMDAEKAVWSFPASGTKEPQRRP